MGQNLPILLYYKNSPFYFIFINKNKKIIEQVLDIIVAIWEKIATSPRGRGGA